MKIDSSVLVSNEMAELTSRINSEPTILVLDSGVGGLSIYQPLRQLLPSLNYIYAFDNAGFPYGQQTAVVVIQRLIQLIDKIQRRHSIAVVVLACNTASTVALPALRQRFSFPIVGVVPAIKSAAKITRNGIIGLLATPATVQRPYLEQLIQQFAVQHQIKRIGSITLVQLAEAKLRGVAVIQAAIEAELAPWLQDQLLPDTVVLGCTHFSLLKTELSAVLPRNTQWIDSAEAVVNQVKRLLLVHYPHQPWNQNHAEPRLRDKHPAYCTQWDPQFSALQQSLLSYQLQLKSTEVLQLY